MVVFAMSDDVQIRFWTLLFQFLGMAVTAIVGAFVTIAITKLKAQQKDANEKTVARDAEVASKVEDVKNDQARTTAEHAKALAVVADDAKAARTYLNRERQIFLERRLHDAQDLARLDPGPTRSAAVDLARNDLESHRAAQAQVDAQTQPKEPKP